MVRTTAAANASAAPDAIVVGIPGLPRILPGAAPSVSVAQLVQVVAIARPSAAASSSTVQSAALDDGSAPPVVVPSTGGGSGYAWWHDARRPGAPRRPVVGRVVARIDLAPVTSTSEAHAPAVLVPVASVVLEDVREDAPAPAPVGVEPQRLYAGTTINESTVPAPTVVPLIRTTSADNTPAVQTPALVDLAPRDRARLARLASRTPRRDAALAARTRGRRAA